MADSVVFTSKLTSTLGSSTISGSSTSTKTLVTDQVDGYGTDHVQQTVTASATAVTYHGVWTNLDMGDVWTTAGHAIQLRNISTSATHEPRIHVGIRAGVTVASGSIVEDTWYLVSGGTLTYDSVDYVVGEMFRGVNGVATFSGAGAVANLVVELGYMYPGDQLGPIRRGEFTASGYGQIGHWISDTTTDTTCPLEVIAVEVRDNDL